MPGVIADGEEGEMWPSCGAARKKLVVSRALACDCRQSREASEQACFLKIQPAVTVDCAHKEEHCPSKLAPHAQGSPINTFPGPFLCLSARIAGLFHLTARRATLLKRLSPRQYARASAPDMTSLSLEAHKKPPPHPPPLRQLQQAYSKLPPKNARLL